MSVLDRMLTRPPRREEVTFALDPGAKLGDAAADFAVLLGQDPVADESAATITFHLEQLGAQRYQKVLEQSRWKKGDPLLPDGSKPEFGPKFERNILVASTTKIVVTGDGGGEFEPDEVAIETFIATSPLDDVRTLTAVCVLLNNASSVLRGPAILGRV